MNRPRISRLGLPAAVFFALALLRVVVACGSGSADATADAASADGSPTNADGAGPISPDVDGGSESDAEAGGIPLTDGAAWPSKPLCDDGGWCWANPLPQGFSLAGVWASSAADIWMVGAYGTIVHAGTDGFTAWGGQTTEGLNAVWGSSASDVWAVGNGGAILHFDGHSWSTSNSGVPQDLRAVWGSGAGDVWAVGAGVALHWTGAAWAKTTIVDSLYGVWGSGPNDVWAVGAYDALFAGTMFHYDGVSWSPVTLPDTGNANGHQPWSLNAVWGSGPSDVWTVGDLRGAIHWNGTAWEQKSLPGAYPRAVSGTSPNDVWVTGIAGQAHFDGTKWTMVPPYSGFGASAGLWAVAANDVWVGSDDGEIAHWDGKTWSDVSRGVTGNDLYDIWGSGPNDVWAVGVVNILHASAPSGSSTSGWTVAKTYSTTALDALRAIWGSGPSDIWAVGQQGTILHYDGMSWTPSTSGTTQGLKDVWGSGPNDVWIVGLGGTILHNTGSGWAPVASGTTQDLYGVWGTGAADVWTSGRPGTLHYDGVSWSTSNANAFGYNLWGTGPGDVWVFSGLQSVEHYDGQTWHTVTTGLAGGCTEAAGWGSSATDVWIACADANAGLGRIGHLSGGTWTQHDVGPTLLFGIWGSGPNDVRVAGTRGTVLFKGP